MAQAPRRFPPPVYGNGRSCPGSAELCMAGEECPVFRITARLREVAVLTTKPVPSVTMGLGRQAPEDQHPDPTGQHREECGGLDPESRHAGEARNPPFKTG